MLKANIPFLFLIFFLVFIVYVNGMNGEFIADDIPAILNNPQVTNFSNALQSLQIQPILQSAIYNIFGSHQAPFHIVSLILHYINTVLFFIIVRHLFKKKVSVISTLVFALHPVNSETVLWISAVNYLIHTIFLFMSIILLLKNKLFVMYAVFFLSMLLTRNFWGFTIPFVLLGINIYISPETKINIKKQFLFFLPMLLTMVLSYFGLKFYNPSNVTSRIIELSSQKGTSYLQRIPYTTYMTAELLSFPKNLTLYHEGEHITKLKYEFMILVTVLTLFMFIYAWYKKKQYFWLLLLIPLSALPIFSPIQVAWFISDRYLYVSSAFFAIFLALLLTKIKNGSVLNTALVLLLIVYSIKTYSRTNDWKTRKSLWHATQRVAPYSKRVYNNLGDVYATEKNYTEAINYFLMAIKIDPQYADAMHNLGYTYLTTGDLDNAEKWLKKSVEINPSLYQSYQKLELLKALREDSPL